MTYSCNEEEWLFRQTSDRRRSSDRSWKQRDSRQRSLGDTMRSSYHQEVFHVSRDRPFPEDVKLPFAWMGKPPNAITFHEVDDHIAHCRGLLFCVLSK